MALFQPTNIYPSSLGELGNGTVDITKPLAVSWQVNGNSAMTAFSLTICKNDAASTQVYSTGKLTAGCPFYGTDYAGNTVLFTYTIPASALSGAGMVNGQQYKLLVGGDRRGERDPAERIGLSHPDGPGSDRGRHPFAPDGAEVRIYGGLFAGAG